MLNAPWGAGKSHAIKPYKGKDGFLYVSLFGVKNSDEINSAILIERLPLLNNAWTKGAGSLIGTALKYTNLELKVGDLAQIALPDTLIFDDLERTGMTVQELFGHLNSFVEHQGKKVILLANEAELEKKSPDYTHYKEKLVGRTLRLNPDIDAAFSAFLVEIKDEAAREVLLENQSRICRVFALSTFENLRLLRQAMLEFTQLFDALDEEMRAHTASVSDLIATYFALHMEYGKGALSREDLMRRDRMFIHTKNKTEDANNLLAADKKYEAECYSLSGPFIISQSAALALIADGYANPVTLCQDLKNTNGFCDSKNEAAWRTVWWWNLREEEQFEAALTQVNADLKNNKAQPAGVLLNVFGSFLSLASEGVSGKGMEQVKNEAIEIIDQLALAGALPPWSPQNMYGFSSDIKSYDGLGFPNAETEEFGAILEHMKTSQRKLFESKQSEIASAILAKIPAEIDEAVEEFAGLNLNPVRSGYLNIPVLNTQDPIKVAKLMIDLSPEFTLKMFQILASRVEAQLRANPENPETETELGWLRRFNNAVEAIAATQTPFRKTQLRTLLLWEFKNVLQEPIRSNESP